jgi:CRISPR-associated protein Cas2
MWERTTEMVRTGRAIMVFSARNEQGLSFLVHGHHWEPIDVDGITLMLRPSPKRDKKPSRSTETESSGSGSESGRTPRTGWSKAARRRAR